MEEKKVRIMINGGIQCGIKTIFKELLEASISNDIIVHTHDNSIYDGTIMSMQDFSNAIQLLNEESSKLSTPQDEIIILKRQLKHCKSYVERQNIERRINKLYREEKRVNKCLDLLEEKNLEAR